MSELRVAHLADSHLDEDNLEGNLRAHDDAIVGIASFDPDLIVHAGDVHHRLGVPATPAVRNSAARIFRELAGIAPVVLVRGNHDLPGDLQLYGQLATTFPIFVRDCFNVFEVRLRDPDKPKLFVQTLPWFTKAHLAAQLKAEDASKGTTDSLAIQAVRELLESARAQGEKAREAGAVVIGVGHVMIGGSVVSSGQTLIGRSVELAPADLARTAAHLWCLGHIHKAQSWQQPDTAIWYAGSLERLNYGEPEAKVWLAHTLELYEEAGVVTRIATDEIPTKATAIVRLEPGPEELADWMTGEDDPGEDLRGAHVRIRFRATPEAMEAIDWEILEKKILALGASKVQLDPIVMREAAGRAEGVTDQLELTDQVLEWAQATGRALSDEQVDRLKEKVAQLEEGAS